MPAINQAKKIIELVSLRAGIPLWIWGPTGVGKSSIVRQVAETNNIEFRDFRLSQIESSDLRGLPYRKNGRTVFLPPVDMPGHSDGQGILFLDELNRAQDDVIQAAFQLVLDRRIGEYRLPEKWVVITAGNFGDDYDVKLPDPALANRFCHIIIHVNSEYKGEWESYIRGKDYDAHSASAIIHYVNLSSGKSLLSLSQQHQQIEELCKPTPRTWELLLSIISCMRPEEMDNEILFPVSAGFIGIKEAAGFCKELTAYLKGMKTIIPEDLINAKDFKEILPKLNLLSRATISVFWHSLVEYCKNYGPNGDCKKNLVEFVKYLIDSEDNAGVDEATAFCKAIAESDRCDEFTKILSMDDDLYKRMHAVFNS